MTPTNAKILARLEAMNAQVELWRFPKTGWRDAYWQCNIVLDHKGMELKSDCSAPSLDDAFERAWATISPIVDTLAFAKVFELPLLTLDATANATDTPV